MSVPIHLLGKGARLDEERALKLVGKSRAHPEIDAWLHRADVVLGDEPPDEPEPPTAA